MGCVRKKVWHVRPQPRMNFQFFLSELKSQNIKLHNINQTWTS